VQIGTYSQIRITLAVAQVITVDPVAGHVNSPDLARNWTIETIKKITIKN